MKIRFAFVFVLMALLLGLNVSAASPKYTISPDENYTVAYSGEDLKEISSILGMKTDELEEYIKENNISMIAANKDNSVQIRFSDYENEFSEKIGDISSLDDAALKDIAPMLANGADYTVKENNKIKYIVILKTLTDGGGVYTSTQYITVSGNTIYQLSCYNEGTETSKEVNKVFSTLKINAPKEPMPIWQTILIVFGIALFAAVAVGMAVSLLKDRKLIKTESETE